MRPQFWIRGWRGLLLLGMVLLAAGYAGYAVRRSTTTMPKMTPMWQVPKSYGQGVQRSERKPESEAVTSAGGRPCKTGGTLVHIQTEAHVLHLCENRRSVRQYPIALGTGGTGKRAARDHKTPLGRYSLAGPRRSEKFGMFVGIGYPTDEQRQRGYTGTDVGIHGPPRAISDLQETMVRMGAPATWSGMTTSVDWTDGCVAVDTDADINAIADWMRRVGATYAVLD